MTPNVPNENFAAAGRRVTHSLEPLPIKDAAGRLPKISEVTQPATW
jgi:hypothetical protein